MWMKSCVCFYISWKVKKKKNIQSWQPHKELVTHCPHKAIQFTVNTHICENTSEKPICFHLQWTFVVFCQKMVSLWIKADILKDICFFDMLKAEVLLRFCSPKGISSQMSGLCNLLILVCVAVGVFELYRNEHRFLHKGNCQIVTATCRNAP